MFFKNIVVHGIFKRGLYGVVLIAIGACLGLLAAQMRNIDEPEDKNIIVPAEETQAPSFQVSTQREMTALKSTNVEWKVRFLGCGHELNEKPAFDITGMTEDQVKEAYSDYSEKLFTSANICLVKEDKGCCPEHYVLYTAKDANKLELHKRDENTFEDSVVLELDMDISKLDDETKALMHDGMMFSSLREINEFMESIEE